MHNVNVHHPSELSDNLLSGVTHGFHRVIFHAKEDGIGVAIISFDDLQRLEALDANVQDRQRAKRRGEKWLQWEDDLMLDGQLDEVDIAIRTDRTLKSVHERRRWIMRIAEARNGK